MILIKSRYRTKSEPKTQKFNIQNQITLIAPKLQNFKQKLLSSSGFAV